MKKNLIIFLLYIPFVGFGQNSNDLVSTLTQLREMQVFKDCQQFKTQMEAQAKEAGKNVSDTQQAKDLEESYTSTWQKYDFFLKTVKQDLMDIQKIQKLSSNSDETANRYLTLMSDVKQEYESKFIPSYQAIVGSKGIEDELLHITIDLVKKIIVKIKARKIEKSESLNTLLPQVNKYFYDNLRLKTWSELDINNSQSIFKSSKIESVDIPPATLNSIEGNIEFIQVDNGQESLMNFEFNSGKNIVSDTDTKKTYKTPYFISSNNYPVGTKFKIKANANVFIYAIVLNTDGIALLHPKVEYRQNGKNIEVVSEPTPTNGEFVLPQNGIFKIVKSNDGSETDSEDFALIISKSELIMEETIEKINAVSGKLDERFSQVFSDQQITYDEAQVQVSGGNFSFSYQKEKNILPLVFKILK